MIHAEASGLGPYPPQDSDGLLSAGAARAGCISTAVQDGPGGTATRAGRDRCVPEQSATRGAFRFTLLALDPYPGTAEAEGDARPVATLRVERL